jgi:hypothetical protein
VLLTSGVLGGGRNAYDFRLDLRVVYQYVCHNHPRPDEPQYPLWQGLPLDSKLTRAELAARVRECTGVGLPSDDAGLNAGVLRYYQADPQAVGALAGDSRPTGGLRLPVLTLHAIHDPTAFVELENAYREIVDSAGASQWLVQTFADEAEHSYPSDAEYPALMQALRDWIERGERPTPQKAAQPCTQMEPALGKGCHLWPDYRSPPLATRVPAAGRED